MFLMILKPLLDHAQHARHNMMLRFLLSFFVSVLSSFCYGQSDLAVTPQTSMGYVFMMADNFGFQGGPTPLKNWQPMYDYVKFLKDTTSSPVCLVEGVRKDLWTVCYDQLRRQGVTHIINVIDAHGGRKPFAISDSRESILLQYALYERLTKRAFRLLPLHLEFVLLTCNSGNLISSEFPFATFGLSKEDVVAYVFFSEEFYKFMQEKEITPSSAFEFYQAFLSLQEERPELFKSLKPTPWFQHANGTLADSASKRYY